VTDKYAVIGNPITHSKSPQIHAAFARQTEQDMSYEAILAPVDTEHGFSNKLDLLIAQGYKGANVTLPFKFEAFLKVLSKNRSQRAELAKAINTLSFRDGEIFGDNTDGIGLVSDIRQNLGFDVRGKRVLLVGAGGAAFGVLGPLREQSPKQLVISNRTVAKAVDAARILEPIAKLQADDTEVLAKSFEDLNGSSFDLVINATSSGLNNQLPAIPACVFASGTLAYDMMYGRETPFMQFAREHGAQVADGLGMLVEQAAAAFFIWRGKHPDTLSVIAQIRSA
jgi:shikimate dehydrogenase